MQRVYDSKHKEEKAKYYNKNREKITERQGVYDSKHKEEKKKFYDENRDNITESKKHICYT